MINNDSISAQIEILKDKSNSVRGQIGELEGRLGDLINNKISIKNEMLLTELKRKTTCDLYVLYNML